MCNSVQTDDLGAALLSPGFAEDLTTWRLTIDESGLVTQDIFLNCSPLYRREVVTRTSQLSTDQLENLLQLAREIRFHRVKGKDYDPGTDDAETTTIVLKTLSGTKRVYASDAFHAAAHEGDTDMHRYVRLWDAILETRPHEFDRLEAGTGTGTAGGGY